MLIWFLLLFINFVIGQRSKILLLMRPPTLSSRRPSKVNNYFLIPLRNDHFNWNWLVKSFDCFFSCSPLETMRIRIAASKLWNLFILTMFEWIIWLIFFVIWLRLRLFNCHYCSYFLNFSLQNWWTMSHIPLLQQWNLRNGP